jgi:hypothetical protein
MSESSIKVGAIADQTGALSFMGIANANVARMVINDINANGGLLGRQIDLHLEDGATTDSVAEAKATKLVQQDHVDLIVGGIYSSTRQAIKGPAVVKGRKLYIYPEQYEGQECDPLIFCTGPVPAQQLEPLIPWLMQKSGAKKFYLPSADYIWPHVMNKKVRELVTAVLALAFGIGMNHGFDLALVGNRTPYTFIDLVMPDGARVHFDRTNPLSDNDPVGATYASTGSSRYYQSQIAYTNNGWQLTMKDGTVYMFLDILTQTGSGISWLGSMRDRYGNAITLQRDFKSGALNRVTSPNGRWIAFTSPRSPIMITA